MEQHRVAERLPIMIGRKDILRSIEQAIDDDANRHAFFIVGKGGMGKTRLLEEIGAIRHARVDTIELSFRWSNIIDLYDTEVQDQVGVEETVAKALDPEDDYFAEFHHEIATLRHRQSVGIRDSVLQSQRQKIHRLFKRGFEELIKTYRVVLTFDTAELLYFEKDEAQALFDIPHQDNTLLHWFTEVVPTLSNCVIVFAGRPVPLTETLKTAFRDFASYHVKEIVPLDRPETDLFLQEMAERDAAVADVMDSADAEKIAGRIFKLSRGRPIYISLIAFLLSFDSQIINDYIDEDDFDDVKAQEAIEKSLVDHLQNLHGAYQDCSTILLLLSLSHQGLSFDLCKYLLLQLGYTDWNEKRIVTTLNMVANFTFVKVRRGNQLTRRRQAQPIKLDRRDRLFFHDKLYEIFDRHFLADRNNAMQYFEVLRDYYHGQLTKIDEIIQTPERRLRTESTERVTLVRKQQRLMLKRLHYELQCDPQRAYFFYYTVWAVDAIRAHQSAFDMRLRSVLLRFIARYLNPQGLVFNPILADKLDLNDVYRDSAVLWMRRLWSESRFQDAIQLAQQVATSKEVAFDLATLDDPLYIAHLKVAHAKVTYRNPNDPTAPKLLNEALELLNDVNNHLDDHKNEEWHQARILGEVYDGLGFLARAGDKFTTASKWYRRAIGTFRMLDVPIDMSITLNNLAYVYGRLGAFNEANTLVSDSIALKRKHSLSYEEAIGYNTYGLIMLEAERFIEGLALCQKAESILDTNGLSRTWAYTLILTALGRAYRENANLTNGFVYNYEEAINHMKSAQRCLRKAIARLKSGGETIELFAAYLELGRLYRDWMELDRDNEDELDHNPQLLDLAKLYYKEAQAVAERLELPGEIANVMQDLADLHLAVAQLATPQVGPQMRHEDIALAEQYCKEALAIIPQEYKPQLGKGFEKIKGEVVNHIYYILGEIYMTKAEILMAQLPPDFTADQHANVVIEKTRWNLLATVCFEKFSPFPSSTRGLRRAREALYQNIGKWDAARLQMQLKSALASWFQEYQLSPEFAHILKYMDDTLGAFGFEDVAVFWS